jgi:hypothetical protein
VSAITTQWNQIFQYEDGQTVHTDERGNPAVTSEPPRKPPQLASDNDQHGNEKRVETLA